LKKSKQEATKTEKRSKGSVKNATPFFSQKK